MLLKVSLEILVQILQDLDIIDLFSCQSISKYLDHLIRDSVVLQYNVALDAAHPQDNLGVSLAFSEELRALKSSEDSYVLISQPRFPQPTINECVRFDQWGLFAQQLDEDCVAQILVCPSSGTI